MLIFIGSIGCWIPSSVLLEDSPSGLSEVSDTSDVSESEDTDVSSDEESEVDLETAQINGTYVRDYDFYSNYPDTGVYDCTVEWSIEKQGEITHPCEFCNVSATVKLTPNSSCGWADYWVEHTEEWGINLAQKKLYFYDSVDDEWIEFIDSQYCALYETTLNSTGFSMYCSLDEFDSFESHSIEIVW
jgi:hypothetical protein